MTGVDYVSLAGKLGAFNTISVVEVKAPGSALITVVYPGATGRVPGDYNGR